MERLQAFNQVAPFGNETNIPLNGRANAISNGKYLCVRKVLEEGIDFWNYKEPEPETNAPAPAEVNNVDTLIDEAPRASVEEISNSEEQ